MNTLPRVSICIPTYNRAEMVGDAIRSALRQTYGNLEILVVDNASTDRTGEVVAGFSDSRLTYIRNPENLGLFGNFNRCIELSTGAFIQILHSDDTIDDHFIETCMGFFSRHPDAAMTFTSARIHSRDRQMALSFSAEDRVFPAPEGFRTLLRERSLIVCPSVIVRRSVYDAIGTYSLEYPYSADYYQWMKITRRFTVGFVHDAWVSYRQGEHSESYRLVMTRLEGYADTLKIYGRIIGELGAERSRYTGELNAALVRYIGDVVFAGFARETIMERYRPSDITGKALAAWAYLSPRSFPELIGKHALRAGILAAGLALRIPPVRSLVRWRCRDRIPYY